jgi:cell division protein FtsQ
VKKGDSRKGGRRGGKPQKPRRRAPPRGAVKVVRRLLLLESSWRRRAQAAAALLALAALGSGVYLWQSGWVRAQYEAGRSALLAASANAGLRVEDVLVAGRERSSRGELLAALGVARGVPILGFDPHVAKARLEALPWVERAIVERRLPDIINLRIFERQPVALWQHQGEIAVIDGAGTVIPGIGVARFAHLPLLVGADVPQHAAALLGLLDKEPNLSRQVAAAVRVRGRRWDLRLENGIDVRLPEEDADRAWATLARMERQNKILSRQVSIIDLRQPDRARVLTPQGAGPGSGGDEPAGEST